MLKELIEKNRSYRRYDPNEQISLQKLIHWVDLARLSPSSRNLQPLKYMIVNTPKQAAKVFSCLTWAGYLPEWEPTLMEAPTAYVIILVDRHITKANVHHDEGIACQSILLGAVNEGYGGCIIASINREQLRQALHIPESLDISLVIALGKPQEEVVICETNQDDIKYFRDENQKHFVPKRKLDELIIIADKE